VEYFMVADRGVTEGLPYHTLKDTTGKVVQGIEQSIGNGSDGLPHRKSFTTKEKRGDGEMDGMALEIQKLDTHGSLKDYKRLEG
jgi:hypothetical protein